MDYNDMLDRAHENVDDFGQSETRLEIPDPSTTFDGSYTKYRNFKKTADVLDRDVEEILTFFQESLATSGSLDGREAKFKGQFTDSDLEQHLEKYVDDFVKCSQCGSPDTQYEENSGVEVIRCTACGATDAKR